MFDPAPIFTSKTRLAVLELFLKRDNLELGIRETAREINSNPMLVRSELILLERSGLFKSRKVANSIQYSLNKECEAIEPFKKILGVS